MNKQEIEKAIETIQRDIRQFEKLLIEQPDSPVRERIKSKISAYKTAISALQQLLTNGWISVDSKMPPHLANVIGCDKYGNRENVVYLDNMKKWKIHPNFMVEMDVIAWQPLPEPYKEDKDAERN